MGDNGRKGEISRVPFCLLVGEDPAEGTILADCHFYTLLKCYCLSHGNVLGVKAASSFTLRWILVFTSRRGQESGDVGLRVLGLSSRIGMAGRVEEVGELSLWLGDKILVPGLRIGWSVGARLGMTLLLKCFIRNYYYLDQA